MNRMTFIVGILLIPFVVFPSLYTLPLIAGVIIFLFYRGFYLEGALILAAVKAFGPWYLGSAAPLMNYFKLPLIAAAIFLGTLVTGALKRIPTSERKTTLISFFALLFGCLFSEEPFLSAMKVTSIFMAYQGLLAFLGIQRKSFSQIFILLSFALLLADAFHRFDLWMPHVIESQKTNLYSSVWNHSQTAGVICGFLFLVIFLISKESFLVKTPLLIYLLYVMYLSQCRTGLIGLAVTLCLITKGFKWKVVTLFLGLCLVFISPDVVQSFLNKRGEVKQFSLKNLYSSRLELVENALHSSKKDLLFGKGLGVGGYFESEEDNSQGEYSKKMNEARNDAKEKGTIKILGYKIKISSPVEYGNLYTGALGAMGLWGCFFLILYFTKYYQMLGTHSKLLFKYLLIINLGEAIMLSPSGNPAMLFILCALIVLSIRAPMIVKKI